MSPAGATARASSARHCSFPAGRISSKRAEQAFGLIALMLEATHICEHFHKTVLNEFLTSCRPISMCGSGNTTSRHIRGAGASAKRRCKLSLTPSRV